MKDDKDMREGMYQGEGEHDIKEMLKCNKIKHYEWVCKQAECSKQAFT